MQVVKTNLTFGEALDVIKSGGNMSRSTWEDFHVYTNVGSENQALFSYDKKEDEFGFGWLPSNEDLFAIDWSVSK